eukprot:gene194-386_t
MAPRKRKAAVATDVAVEATQQQQTQPGDNKELLQAVNDRLQLLDAAVEERCEAIMAAADDAIARLMQELKMQLIQLPKKKHAQCAAFDASAAVSVQLLLSDGNSFAVDGAAGGLEAVPVTHREEVAEKLRAIQALAAKALGV